MYRKLPRQYGPRYPMKRGVLAITTGQFPHETALADSHRMTSARHRIWETLREHTRVLNSNRVPLLAVCRPTPPLLAGRRTLTPACTLASRPSTRRMLGHDTVQPTRASVRSRQTQETWLPPAEASQGSVVRRRRHYVQYCEQLSAGEAVQPKPRRAGL